MHQSENKITLCEKLVIQALEDPLVKTIVKGLEKNGCSFSLLRHVVCEPCQEGLAGG